MGLKCNWIHLTEWWTSTLCLSLISKSDKSSDMSKKRGDRGWTLFFHIWGHLFVWLKVQGTHTVSVLPLWVCSLSFWTLTVRVELSELQNDPLGPYCSPPAGPVHPRCSQSRDWGPSCNTTNTTSTGPGRRWLAGRGRERRVGNELRAGRLWVSQWILWLNARVHGWTWWSVPIPLPIW